MLTNAINLLLWRCRGAFYRHLDKIKTGDWVELHKCKICGQHWRIDGWDQGQQRFVVKIDDTEKWQDFDITPLIKDLLLKNRGGLIDKECIWAGCKNKRVKGVVYCVDHLYETGARK